MRENSKGELIDIPINCDFLHEIIKDYSLGNVKFELIDLFDNVGAFLVNVIPSMASEVATIFLVDLACLMSSETEEIDELYVF
jgi:hypothetical protein